MRKGMKKVAVVLGMVGMLASVAACKPKFDAAGYVESYVESNYKGDFKEYAEICKVDESKPKEIYDKAIDSLVQNMSAGLTLDDESTKKFEKLAADMLGSVKYTVDDKTDYKDGKFTVKVTAECLQMKVDTNEAFEIGKKVGEKAAEDYLKTHKKIDQNAYQQLLQDKMKDALYEYFETILKNATYGEPKEITVTIEKNSEGLYGISETEETKLANALVSMDYSK